MLNSHAQRSLLRKSLVPIEETFFKCRLLAKCRPWPALNSPSLDDQCWPSKSMRSTRPFERPGTSHCRVWILARLLADLAEFLNHPLVIEGIDGVDINIHQIHVRLQKGGEFLGVVCLDEQKPCSAELFVCRKPTRAFLLITPANRKFRPVQHPLQEYRTLTLQRHHSNRLHCHKRLTEAPFFLRRESRENAINARYRREACLLDIPM